MNIFKALQLVGKHPVVGGFWRNASMAASLVGIMVLLLVVFPWKINIFNWLIFSLILIFAIMTTLPLYLPTADQKPQKNLNLK